MILQFTTTITLTLDDRRIIMLASSRLFCAVSEARSAADSFTEWV
jgi:hypothetical protein